MYIVSVPLTPLSTFMDKWIFGEILCKVTGASQVSADSEKNNFSLRLYQRTNSKGFVLSLHASVTDQNAKLELIGSLSVNRSLG